LIVEAAVLLGLGADGDFEPDPLIGEFAFMVSLKLLTGNVTSELKKLRSINHYQFL